MPAGKGRDFRHTLETAVYFDLVQRYPQDNQGHLKCGGMQFKAELLSESSLRYFKYHVLRDLAGYGI